MFPINAVLEIIKKVIPDKASQDKALEEFYKLQQENTEHDKAKLPMIEKMVYFTFPLLVWILAFGFICDILLQLWSGIAMKETMILNIPDGLISIIQLYLGFFFGKRTVEKFAK